MRARRSVTRIFRKRPLISLQTGKMVRKVEGNKIYLADLKEPISFGACVWSTGVAPVKLLERLEKIDKCPRTGRVFIDDRLRICGHETAFAIGDCAMNRDKPLAQLAQVAERQADFLAKHANSNDNESSASFQFINMGSMTSVGDFQAVVEVDPKSYISVGNSDDPTPFTIQGILAWLAWRSYYWSKTISIQNRMLIPMFWFKSIVFGRDISRF